MPKSKQSSTAVVFNLLRQEVMVLASWISAVLFMLFNHELLSDLSNPFWLGFIFI